MNETADVFLPSEPIPDYNDHLITKLTGRTYKKIILGDFMDNDVLVYFYTDHCNICQKYGPEFTRMAETLANHPNLKFAKMDAQMNMV